MLKSSFAVYLGKERPDGFSGFVAENNLYLIIEVESGIGGEKGREIIQKIKEDAANLKIENLTSFDNFISGIITGHNFPASFSLAAGYFTDGILYLKTIGAGKIYLQRGNQFAQIIENNNSASGTVNPEDFFIFTSGSFIDLLGSDLELKTIFDHKDAHTLVEDLTPQLKGKPDEGVIVLFNQFKRDQSEQVVDEEPIVEEKVKKINPILENARTIFIRASGFIRGMDRRKLITLTVVLIILFVLIWSLRSNYIKGSQSAISKKINSTKESVSEKLREAEENAFLNLPKSLTLLNDAKKEVKSLKEDIGDENKEVEELENLIKEKESNLVKKEEKKFEEFYVLTLDNKDAKGSRLYLNEDTLGILDNGKNLIYKLSLSKKSIDKENAPEIKNASFISNYQDYVLFYVNGAGVYKISADGKKSKVIENDKEWQNISGIWVYNGNLYLLDSGKGDIYKYLVAEKGYSEKSSYLGGNAGSVKEGNSLAIDSSVYVGLSGEILKFTAGNKDEFSTSWPEKNIKLTKIFTSGDTEKVYAWDKSNGVIYILGKKGTYERQINSSILTKVMDFVVYKNTAFLILAEKIYKINLD